MATDEERPFWDRIGDGTIDLSQYTDDEILDIDLLMPDGRKAPKPRDLPPKYRDEFVRRTQAKAKQEIADGALKAIRVKSKIMNDKKVSAADRLRASDFFVNRFLGTEAINLNVAQKDKIEDLFETLLKAEGALLPADATEE